MAGWHSLSGFLLFRTGGGISILRSKKKVWCVLEESECRLLCFKAEDDVRQNKSPLENINIKSSAISLDLDNKNQFVILSEGKEYIFMAENHESMMIWLLGLQAKRERSIRSLESKTKQTDTVLLEPQRKYSDVSNPYISEETSSGGASCIDGVGRRKVQWQKYRNTRSGDTSDTGSSAPRGHLDGTRSRSLPPVFEVLELPKNKTLHRPLSISKSLDAEGEKGGQYKENLQKLLLSQASVVSEDLQTFIHADNYCKSSVGVNHDSSSGGDSDDVFGEHHLQELKRLSQDNQHVTLRRMDTVDSAVAECSVVDPGENKEIGSSSSLSVSSDSAIDKGETNSTDMSVRLVDLEKELISTKCELAKVINQQSSYQDLLAQRDDAIRFLEGRLDTSGSSDSGKLFSSLTSKTSPKSAPKSPKLLRSDKEMQEKLRVLQHQNKFLNEEVKKLAKLRQTERENFFQQEERVRALEADIEKWKLDYVTLIRSSIRFPGGDTMDDAELVLFGGDRHKFKIMQLLENARKINPSLPTYESLKSGEVHVDKYGFKHVFGDEGLLLHYLCQELTQHYLVQAGSYEDHQRKWTHFMRQHGKSICENMGDLKQLCRGGIPDRFRKQVWKQLIQHKAKDIIGNKGPHYYRNLCNMLPDSPLASCYRKQISLDLMRTMPGNIKFSTAGCKGIMDLQDVLLAYCVHNPATGYCQGMNFIVGMSLLFLDVQDAFWTIVAVIERYFPNHYFDQNLIGAQADQQVMKEILTEKLPALAKHLESIDIEISTVTLNWFLAIFFDAVPFQTLLRMWDCFLLEGPKVLFRFTIAILKLNEKELMQKTDTISVMRHLKASAKLTYDVEGLLKIAFEDINPFPRRRDIMSKQACFLKTLKEQIKQKELQRLAFAEREQLYMSMECESGNYMGIGAAVALDDGKIWYCYGDQNVGKVCKISCEEGIMYDVSIEFDSRVMCMFAASQDVILLGTLSWMLYAYNARTRDNLWKLQLHDAILSLCCYKDEDVLVTRTFAGLADGTLAVMEQSRLEEPVPSNDIMYIPIGQAPIACLLLLDDQLWCASGNTVYIIHARTLDHMDSFTVSVNPFDHILSMVVGQFGIWIILRGSSILELWDPKQLTCKMLYDTRTDRYPQLKREDDTYFNKARITAVADIGKSVWIGTGEGNLIIYDVFEQASLRTPTDPSPSTETLSSFSSVPIPPPRKNRGKKGSKSSDGTATPPAKAEFSIGQEKGKKVSSVEKVDKNALISCLSADTNGKPSSDQGGNLSSNATSTLTLVPSDTTSTGTSTPKVVNSKTTDTVDDTPKKEANKKEKSHAGTKKHMRLHRLSDKKKSNLSPISSKKSLSSVSGKSSVDNHVKSNGGLSPLNGSRTPVARSASPFSNASFDSSGTAENISKVVNVTDLDKSVESNSVPQSDLDSKENSDIPSKQKKIGRVTPMVTNSVQDKKASPKCSQNHSQPSENKNEVKDEAGDLCELCYNDNTKKANGQKPKAFRKKFSSDSIYQAEQEDQNLLSSALAKLNFDDMDQSGKYDKVMSRNHKVNSWLNSLEDTSDEEKSHFMIGDGEQDEDEGQEKSEQKDPKDSNGHLCNGLEDTSEKNVNIRENGKSLGSNSTCSQEEDYQDAEDQPATPEDLENSANKDAEVQAISNSNSETSLQDVEDFQSAADKNSEHGTDTGDINMVTNSKNPELKYRLDFSGMYIETDSEIDSNLRKESVSDVSLFNSRQNSLDGQAFTGYMKRVSQTDVAKIENWSINLSGTLSTSSSEHKILDKLPTHTLHSRKLSLSKPSRDYLEWNESKSTSPHGSLDQRVADFLRTPSISSRPSSLWSSYENISTPSHSQHSNEGDISASGKEKKMITRSSFISHSTSSNSLCSMQDLFYSVDLVLQVKVKIADKPVRNFIESSCCGKQVMLSFSGCHGDDEAVLKWKKEPNERIWTNDPVIEICPKTKLTRLPSYMRGRLSSASSHNSSNSTLSAFSLASATSKS